MIHIAQDGSGDFISIQEALHTLPPDNPSETILLIHKGIYKEQITVTVPCNLSRRIQRRYHSYL